MLCFACVFCGPYGINHTVGHYQLAAKCVEVCACVSKVFCILGICSWWRSDSFFFLECFSSHSVNSLAVSGPATIHRLSAVSGPATIHRLSAVSDPATIHRLSAVSDPVTIHRLSAVSGPVTIHRLSAVSFMPITHRAVSLHHCIQLFVNLIMGLR